LKEESISLLFLEPHWFLVNQNLVILLEFFIYRKDVEFGGHVYLDAMAWEVFFVEFEGYEQIFGKGCVKISKNGISLIKKEEGFGHLFPLWFLLIIISLSFK
jgi:hypothetical protein